MAPRGSDGGRGPHASAGQGERERTLRFGLWADLRRRPRAPAREGQGECLTGPDLREEGQRPIGLSGQNKEMGGKYGEFLFLL
jgi:hypothetical protein